MPFYTVLRKPIYQLGLFSNKTKNPSKRELLQDLETYPKIYLFTSLEDANNVAESFNHAPRMPKVSGSYGFVVKIQVSFDSIPKEIQIEDSVVYNNWIKSQHIKYTEQGSSDKQYSCVVINPQQIKDIIHTYIPDYAKAYNSNLKDTDFQTDDTKCLLM